jgi:hypothetical protein
MYLTYEEYINMGGILEETAFLQYEFEARALIDWWTFNRLQQEKQLSESVKRCMYALIQLAETKGKAMLVSSQTEGEGIQAGITHESNDGVSTTYNTLSAKEALDSVRQEAESVIQLYLNGVRNSLGHKVLYRGIYPNE